MAAKEKQRSIGNDASERSHAILIVVWRDVIFLIMGALALQVIGYVETNAYDASLRGGGAATDSGSPIGVVDTGFFLTFGYV